MDHDLGRTAQPGWDVGTGFHVRPEVSRASMGGPKSAGPHWSQGRFSADPASML